MQQGSNFSQLSELQDSYPIEGVYFDGENARLEGNYRDEISAYRAKKNWAQVLANYFLLETDGDIKIVVTQDSESGQYLLRCDFMSACARYAFWRLTNSQTPEAQYMIEIAHIPQCESHRDEFLRASDLKPIEFRTNSSYSIPNPLIDDKQESNYLRKWLNRLLQDAADLIHGSDNRRRD